MSLEPSVTYHFNSIGARVAEKFKNGAGHWIFSRCSSIEGHGSHKENYDTDYIEQATDKQHIIIVSLRDLDFANQKQPIQKSGAEPLPPSTTRTRWS